MEVSWGVEMALRTQRGGEEGREGRLWRGAWDCPWWMGGAVSMRWAGRLWAGPDGLAGLRAAVCALQTVVGETTINIQRLLEWVKKKKQKGLGDSCKKKEIQPHLGFWSLPHSPSPTRPIYPNHDFVPSLGFELPSHLPPTGEPRPPTGNPHLTSVAIKRCALNLGRNHLFVFDAQHNQWSSFFPRREQLRLRIWVFTLFDGFPLAW